MVGRPLVSNRALAEHEIPGLEPLLQSPCGPNGDEPFHAALDELFKVDHCAGSPDSKVTDNGDSILRFPQEEHLAEEALHPSRWVMFEHVLHEGAVVSDN